MTGEIISGARQFLWLSVIFAALTVQASPDEIAPVAEADQRRFTDLAYVPAGGPEQRLDLSLPTGRGPHPLIVYVHGGAWRGGSKAESPLLPLLSRGFAVASLNYRLTPQAPFPAQLHDIHAAIRFLRAHAAEYQLDSQRFALAGTSAGGHLAVLAGLTSENPDVRNQNDANPSQSSAVQALVSISGASDLTTILAQSTPHGLAVRVPALDLLLGGSPESRPALAQLASPVFQVGDHSPPLLLIHGDQDPQMPVAQAHELEQRYREKHLPVQLEIIPGAGHGGPQFSDAVRLELITSFLSRHLAPP